MVVAGALVGPMTGNKGFFDLQGEVARALCPAVNGALRPSQFSAAAGRTFSTLAKAWKHGNSRCWSRRAVVI